MNILFVDENHITEVSSLEGKRLRKGLFWKEENLLIAGPQKYHAHLLKCLISQDQGYERLLSTVPSGAFNYDDRKKIISGWQSFGFNVDTPPSIQEMILKSSGLTDIPNK